MNDDDMPPPQRRAVGEIYGNDKQKNVALPTSVDAERYSQHAVPVKHSSVIQQQAVPLSQSLLHASSTSLTTPSEAQRVDVPPTALRRQGRGSTATRYMLISFTVLALTIFAALFVFHQLSSQNPARPTNKIAATQTADEQAAVSANKATAISYLATQTALVREPYHVTVPGPCNNNPGWSSEPSDMQANAIQCLPSSVKLAYTSQQPAYARVMFSVNGVYPITRFQHFSIVTTVLDLTIGSCMAISVQGVATPLQMCRDDIRTLTGYPSNSYSIGAYHPNNPDMLVVQIRIDETSEQYFVDDTLFKSISRIQDVSYQGVAGVTFEVFPKSFNPPHGGAMNLRDFSLTPLL